MTAKYKVLNQTTAKALQDYWRQLGFDVQVELNNSFWEVTNISDHPMFREICDAFVAGRRSMVD